MGGVPLDLAARLRETCGLRRAIETGTYKGGGAQALAAYFEEVQTIELSEELALLAREWQPDYPNVTVVNEDSRIALTRLVDRDTPTLYFLDGHWSGGPTAGEQDECPVMGELGALKSGGPEDCIIVDDARLFACPPPPPHDPAQWPTLVELFDKLRELDPGRHTTLVGEYVINVPAGAKAIVDDWGAAVLAAPFELARRKRGLRRFF